MAYDPMELQNELSRRTGRRVLLFLNNNRRRMVSARNRGEGVVEVRLQKIFLKATSAILDELARLILGRAAQDAAGPAALRAFIDTAFAAPDGGDSPPVRPRQAASPERSRSHHHDIAAYARHLNQVYLENRSTAGIVWGRRSNRRSRRSIRFACYDPERNLVIVNRKLDKPDIPAYFVEYILFHEMLHEVLGIGKRGDGRRDIHGSLFKLMESTFPDFDKAVRYERELCKHLGSL